MSVQANFTANSEPAGLVVDSLVKSYGSTRALRGLSLVAQPHQVVGIVGPNGAGKSTFVRVLAGEETEDDGTITVDSVPLLAERRRQLVAVVHQEPQLFPNLTVVENLMIDRQGIARPKPTREVRELLARLELEPVADQALETTSIMVWQLTEIARALLRSAKVFLFDEPNSALTKEESERLFEHMEGLRGAGKFVFLVSHRLGEVAEVCRQVVVVRDGAVVASLAGEAVTSDRLSSLLTAEEFGTVAPQGPAPSVHLRQVKGVVEPFSADRGREGSLPPFVASASGGIVGVPGQVVAVTGPEGGGGRELVRAARITGAASERQGQDRRAYVPADRRHCLFFNMSVAANISVRLEQGQLPGDKRFVNRRVLAQAAAEYIERFSIKTEHAGSSIVSLSGGNQQKVALASALAVQPALLVIEEPTRGVDIRTKLQIYEILRSFASSGGAVVMFVNELEDVLGCADCLYAVSEGTVRGRIEVGREDELEQLGLMVNGLLSGEPTHAA